MFDDDFFIKLEWEIFPKALEEVETPATRGFWCDGVMKGISDIYYTKKSVNDHRYVPLRAYVGVDGQDLYDLILYFGPKAVSRYARDLSIVACIPDTHASEWFRIDVQQQKIEIQLL